MTRPAYMSRETLAQHLEIKPGAVDQYVRRGLLPSPVTIGEALRWRWDDVDEWIRSRTRGDVSGYADDVKDPYMPGTVNASPAPASRVRRPQQGATVLLPAAAQRHAARRAEDQAT